MKRYLLIFSLFAFSFGNASAQMGILPRGEEAIYIAEFNLMGTSINGFLAVSHSENGTLHVSFTSPMGNNLLEMERKKGRWKKAYAIKKLGSRHLYSMLGEDIFLLLGQYDYEDRMADYTKPWKWGKDSIIPIFEGENLVSFKVLSKRNHSSKTVTYKWDLTYYFIKKFRIEHEGFPFSIELKPLSKSD